VEERKTIQISTGPVSRKDKDTIKKSKEEGDKPSPKLKTHKKIRFFNH